MAGKMPTNEFRGKSGVRNMIITLRTVSLNPDTIGSGHIVKNEFSLKSKMAAKIIFLNICQQEEKQQPSWSAVPSW